MEGNEQGVGQWSPSVERGTVVLLRGMYLKQHAYPSELDNKNTTIQPGSQIHKSSKD